MKNSSDKKVSFAPYRITTSRRTANELSEINNQDCYLTYGGFSYGEWDRIRTNPLHAYHRFLASILQRDDLEIIPFRDILSRPRPTDRVQVVIRHDVDIDIGASLAQAKIETELGAKTTYFFLHTAPYHAELKKDVVVRHEAIAHHYRTIQDLGHEVALHNDAMHVYQNWHMDGAAAVETEIQWMRSCGLDVVGTVQHNSASVYGVENYDLFIGRNTPNWKPSEQGDFKADGLFRYKGKYARYHCIDEKALGLSYEGTDLFKYGDGRIEYGATRYLNRWRWNMHIARYKTNPAPPMEWFADEDTVIQDILALPPGTLVILTVHPCYYGGRHSGSHSPVLRRQDAQCVHNMELGWNTYQPDAVHCVYMDDGSDPRQAINPANELGMLDFSWPDPLPEPAKRIVVMGGEIFDAPHVGFEAHFHAVCERLLRTAFPNDSVFIRKLTHPSMGIDRLWGWCQNAGLRFKPHYVVWPIGPASFFDSLWPYWHAATGTSPSAWPGSGLWFDQDLGQFTCRHPDSNWKQRQMKQRRPGAFTLREWESIIDQEPTSLIGGLPAPIYLEKLYRHVANELGQQGIQCLFVYDGPGAVWDDAENQMLALSQEHDICLWTEGWAKETAASMDAPLIPIPQATSLTSRPAHFHTNGLWTAAHHCAVAADLFVALRDLINSTISGTNGGDSLRPDEAARPNIGQDQTSQPNKETPHGG
jgi:hypothetical protein